MTPPSTLPAGASAPGEGAEPPDTHTSSGGSDPSGIQVTKALLQALPKAELHVHLDGSLRPTTMLELASAQGVELPAQDPASLAEAMRASETRNLEEYLAKFAVTLSLMQEPSALEWTAYELAEDAAAENVRYLEVRYSPVLHTGRGMTLEEAVEAPLRGLAAAEDALGIRTGLIICGMRHMDSDATLELAELAVAFKGRGVVGFDLAGAEAGNPARGHSPACKYVADHNLPITIHAGEGFGPQSIAQALTHCHARRIGHGTRLQEDPGLEAYVNDFRIPLEVCLTSNVQTGVAPSYREHPFRRYFEKGLVVTLNTDNRLISGVTLTDEYWLAHEHLGLGWEALKEVTFLGFQAAFLPYGAKANLLEEVEAEVEALEAFRMLRPER